MEEDDFYHDNALDWAKEATNFSARKIRSPNHYKIQQEEDLTQLLQNHISKVSDVLVVSREVSCTLIFQNNWSLTSALDKWFADNDGGGDTSPNPPAARESVVLCKICYEETSPQDTVSTACGHPFCAECWKTYIATAINDGVGCVTLLCPEPGCKATVGVNIVDSLTTGEVREKYYKYLTRSFVERSRKRKWCPAAGCDRAIEFDAFLGDSYDVTCGCSHRFCWRCGEENHCPVYCETAANWLGNHISVAAEALSAKWISTNTKRCQKCFRRIYKTDGCNHINCPAPCGFQFCWACLGSLQGHGDGGCNKEVEVEVEVPEAEDSTTEKKLMSENQSYYYEKWEFNNKCKRRALASLNGARWSSGIEEAQVQLAMTEAWEQIVECWRVVTWSYVHGFFLSLDKEGNMEKMIMWKFLQEKVDVSLESLQKWCLTKSSSDDDDNNNFRMNLIDLTWLTKRHLENLVNALMEI